MIITPLANISIPPPLAGWDGIWREKRCARLHFNPPTPRRVGRIYITSIAIYSHFNPPTPRRVGPEAEYSAGHKFIISIPPPLAGWDVVLARRGQSPGRHFNPPTPRRVGHQMEQNIAVRTADFNPPTPRRVGLGISVPETITVYDFNPPTPRRVGQLREVLHDKDRVFQSPHPSQGGTTGRASLSGGSAIFQSPHPSQGGTLRRWSGPRQPVDFNPPTPRRVGLAFIDYGHCSTDFNPPTPRRVGRSVRCAK